MKLHNIEQEAADCRAANADAKIGDPLLHIHHGSEAVGRLTEPVENRIAYILKHKPKEEQALRLRLMRRVTEAQAEAYDAGKASARAAFNAAMVSAWTAYDDAAYKAARASAALKAAKALAWVAYDAAVATAHRAVCVPDCPWDRRSIFA